MSDQKKNVLLRSSICLDTPDAIYVRAPDSAGRTIPHGLDMTGEVPRYLQRPAPTQQPSMVHHQHRPIKPGDGLGISDVGHVRFGGCLLARPKVCQL